MFKIKRNALFEDNKINYINEYNTKCLVQLEMFKYELGANIEDINDDFLDKYEKYLKDNELLMPTEDVIKDMLSLVYRWNMIYSMLNVFENIHNEYTFNQCLELLKSKDIEFYNRVIKNKDNFENKVVLVGNYILKDMSDKFEELQGIDGNINNIISKN